MNIDKMTLDECRDYIAACKGWTKHERPFDFTSESDDKWRSANFPHEIRVAGGICMWWEHPDYPGEKRQIECPIRATIDAIAASLPEGFRWHRICSCPSGPYGGTGELWEAIVAISPDGTRYACAADTELLARARTACIAWQVIESESPK